MSVKYYYNIFMPPVTLDEIGGDILSGVRRGYFTDYDKISDKISLQSDADALSYSYSIAKDKPMRWLVKDPAGEVMQDVSNADNGRYYINEYTDGNPKKRILFSKLHTLLKVEYFFENGLLKMSFEPRKAKDELCLLMKKINSAQPVILYARPEVEEELIPDVVEHFPGNVALAQTDDGIVLYLADGLRDELIAFCDSLREKRDNKPQESFLDGEASLGDKLNAKDFNVKRNLSSSIDITKAANFSYDGSESEPEITEEAASSAESQSEMPSAEDIAQVISEAVEMTTPGGIAGMPDKVIDSDGESYLYYGELDLNGNRSGFGRTVTPDGKTAYEGSYLNDMRSGNGSYYYKDGSLCYAGGWDQNRRSGVGVGVSSQDGSIHTGRWIDNKPVGNGVRMTKDGELKFVCKTLSDGSTVLIHFMPDDSVILSKYDENGMKLGEENLSLADFLSDKL